LWDGGNYQELVTVVAATSPWLKPEIVVPVVVTIVAGLFTALIQVGRLTKTVEQLQAKNDLEEENAPKVEERRKGELVELKADLLRNIDGVDRAVGEVRGWILMRGHKDK
jgi:hypothetical protein